MVLEKNKKRLLNWSPAVPFPTEGSFPVACPIFKSLVRMYFHPDPAQRLRIAPIDGMWSAVPIMLDLINCFP